MHNVSDQQTVGIDQKIDPSADKELKDELKMGNCDKRWKQHDLINTKEDRAACMYTEG